MRFSMTGLGVAMLALATPALAQDETEPTPAFKVTGGTTLTSDYRFRGVTQTDEDGAIQSTVNVNHESGLYVGVWTSTIDGSGDTPALAGYGGAEVDLYGGFSKAMENGLGVDVGLLYYLYPGNRDGLNTDFFEPYASVTYSLGPVATKVGVAYAWGGQDGLDGFDVDGGNDDNIYVFGDASIGIPTTPVTLKGHLGYSSGSLGSLNPVGSGDNNYFDWSAGAEAIGGPFKVGVSYVDTDITHAGNFDQRLGRGSTVLGYVGWTF